MSSTSVRPRHRMLLSWILVMAVLMMAVSLAQAPKVGAHEDPVDCSANALNSTLTALPAGTVEHGDVVTYRVTYANVGANACNITELDANLT